LLIIFIFIFIFYQPQSRVVQLWNQVLHNTSYFYLNLLSWFPTRAQDIISDFLTFSVANLTLVLLVFLATFSIAIPIALAGALVFGVVGWEYYKFRRRGRLVAVLDPASRAVRDADEADKPAPDSRVEKVTTHRTPSMYFS
jgi:ABC-type multidrug transport system fused ATPase/permease subunit